MAAKRKVVLTDAQFAYLDGLMKGDQTAVENYAPANKLFALGFATRVMGQYTFTYTVTEAGRKHHHAVLTAPKACKACKTTPWTCRGCGRKTCQCFCVLKDGKTKTALCGRCKR